MSTPRFDVLKTAQIDRSAFAEDVEYYLSLTPRQLPSRYLYDELGSALFDAICHLPWYHVARTERQLLNIHARSILSRGFTTLVELGPGNGTKLATLIDSSEIDGPLTVHLVDISAAALETAACALGGRQMLTVVPHRTTYEEGLSEVSRNVRGRGRVLALLLGSNIGNFDPPGAEAFLRKIRTTLSPGDALLLGADLVKSEEDLLLAYDDPLGVMAAFNRNLLVRVNRELGSNFDVNAFAHRAVWNASESRVEMHLVSREQQRVQVPASHLDITLDAGETIWTESSYKYRQDQVLEMLTRAGFHGVGQWTKDHFCLTLAEAT
jgi:L-histidine N-alpha-methyltransferase